MTIGALVFQLALIIHGGRVLDEAEPDPMFDRLWHFVSYFTIQSNVLVAVAAAHAGPRPAPGGLRRSEPLRLAGMVGITVTGVVHFTLLRPAAATSHGADYVADKLLHMVVPGARRRRLGALRPATPHRALRPGLVDRLAAGLPRLRAGRGRGQRLVPLPVPRRRRRRAGATWLVAAVGITVLFLLFIAAATLVDRRATPAPEAWDPYRGGTAQP